jgi:prevent-host-death family protein
MDTVNVHEAKTHFSKLLTRVEQGEEIVIARAGTPVARLVPVPPRPRRLGLLKGRVQILPGFGDPLPESVAAPFRGEGS